MFVDFNKQIETIHKIRTGEIKTGLKLGIILLIGSSIKYSRAQRMSLTN